MAASLLTCADCTTQYALDLKACPHCGSSNYIEGGAVTKRLPLFVTLRCTNCLRGPWTVRLESKTSGLIELPTLACASCGSRVPVTWPPEEEPMSPKITVHGGATNAREADVSPVVTASQPQDAAEGVLGRPTSEIPDEFQGAVTEEESLSTDDVPTEEPQLGYGSMTLQELRDTASDRGLPSYGTKSQIVERLQGPGAA